MLLSLATRRMKWSIPSVVVQATLSAPEDALSGANNRLDGVERGRFSFLDVLIKALVGRRLKHGLHGILDSYV